MSSRSNSGPHGTFPGAMAFTGRSRARPANQSPAVPQLSCQLCRDRKIRCDKLDPCTSCVRSQALCVPVRRMRLPRGKHVKRPSAVEVDLTARVRRLEALINDAQSSGRGPKRLVSEQEHLQLDENVVPRGMADTCADLSTTVHQHNSSIEQPQSFWSDLAQEIHGLRDVVESGLHDEADDEDIYLDDSGHASMSFLALSRSNEKNTPSQGWNRGSGMYSTVPGNMLDRQLCEVYLQQVDPIIKILHRPSLEKAFLVGQSYLGLEHGHPSVNTILSAIKYSAAGSMTERQCQVMFSGTRYTNKDELLADCRRECEAKIECSDLLSTRDMTVLQAFVLYLAARRAECQDRPVWNLVALAVRIAKGLSLFAEPEKPGRRETFFEQQQRGRLWLTICLLDLQVSHHFASQPLIDLDEVLSAFSAVRHVDDADFGPDPTEPAPDAEGITDMTYAFVKYKLQVIGRLTNFGTQPTSLGGNPNGKGAAVQASPHNQTLSRETRRRHAKAFEDEILHLLRLCDPESSGYAWFVFHSAQGFMASTKASALRPLQQRINGTGLSQPRAACNVELLRHGTQALSKTVLVHTDARGEGYRWAVTIQWHVLAICLAECYICTDPEVIRNVWPILEAAFRLNDAPGPRSSGQIQRGPLGRLMQRTWEKVSPMLVHPPLDVTALAIIDGDTQSVVRYNSQLEGQTDAYPNGDRLEPFANNQLPSPMSISQQDTIFCSDPLDESWNSIWEDVMESIYSTQRGHL